MYDDVSSSYTVSITIIILKNKKMNMEGQNTLLGKKIFNHHKTMLYISILNHHDTHSHTQNSKQYAMTSHFFVFLFRCYGCCLFIHQWDNQSMLKWIEISSTQLKSSFHSPTLSNSAIFDLSEFSLLPIKRASQFYTLLSIIMVCALITKISGEF